MNSNESPKSQKQFLGKLIFQCVLEVETGLHIGGGSETLTIGGLDHPVIREPLTNYPYLPGSSIKGKLRSILERFLNCPINRKGSRDTWRYESDDLIDGYSEIDGQYIKFTGANNCQLSRVFGSTGANCLIEINLATKEGLVPQNSSKKTIVYNNQNVECIQFRGRNHPARLIVRDCHLKKESIEELREIDTGLYMTEWKFENSLDRVTSAANPRQLERVPAGAKFNFEMVYTVEDETQAEEDLKNLVIALAILQDDALGGHGSRGYGKIKFQNIKLEYRPREWYQNPDIGTQQAEFENVEDMLKRFGTIQETIKLLSSEKEG